MNSTDKLLRAFIEAQGYEFEEIRSECSAIDYDASLLIDGKYYKFDYKVTKKGFISGLINDWNDLNDKEKLMILKEEIKKIEEVPCSDNT